MPNRIFQEIELHQPYSLHQSFTFSTPLGPAQDALTLSGMDVANKISFVIELADAYIEFDGDATTSRMFMPIGTSYSDDGITIDTRISILRSTTTNARIRGIAWGRQ